MLRRTKNTDNRLGGAGLAGMIREVDETYSGLNCGSKTYVPQQSQNVTLFGIRVIIEVIKVKTSR